MKIIIDILHPAHVHFFRNFIQEMERKGHEILITARKKDVVLELLKEYGFDFTCISELKKGGLGLLKEFVYRTYRLYKIAKKFKPDVLLGVMGPSITVVGRLLGVPAIVFYNNENAKMTNFFAYPLASAVCTSSSYSAKVNGRHITYPGYHEFAYLHPKRFKPNKKALKKMGIGLREKYILVRFVSFQASHDVGERGLSDKKEVVETLKEYGEVYITSESGLPEDLKKYVLKIKDKKDIFDVINFASLVFGEGATIASEAAMLGVPAVFVNSLQLGYLKELERDYGLVYNFRKQKPGLSKAIELLKTKNIKKEHQEKRRKMLKDKIDVTKWMIDFVENKKWKIKK
jgi:predicted glycosyltransferase